MVTELIPGIGGNFQKWKIELYDAGCEKFPLQADVIKSNIEYVPPGVTPADYEQPVGKSVFVCDQFCSKLKSHEFGD